MFSPVSSTHILEGAKMVKKKNPKSHVNFSKMI
jgi:hypothetical protein